MRTIHLGVIAGGTSTDLLAEDLISGLPDGMITDDDSFLVWGERPDEDSTLHVLASQTISDDMPPADERAAVLEARYRLSQFLSSGARLLDWAVTTDTETWSEKQRVYLLDEMPMHMGEW